MFTGIIQCLGTIRAIETLEHGQAWWIRTAPWSFDPVVGDSIAVNGCCLTVAERGRLEPGDDAREIRFDVIPQTLRVTALGERRAGQRVNLESPVTATTLLSGHVVQGHIDGVGRVCSVERDGGEWRLAIEPPAPLRNFIVGKGSIAVDGVSLTVAELSDDRFEVALIPTTLDETTLGTLETGSRVNLETDYLVKAVVGYLKRSDGATERRSDEGEEGAERQTPSA